MSQFPVGLLADAHFGKDVGAGKILGVFLRETHYVGFMSLSHALVAFLFGFASLTAQAPPQHFAKPPRLHVVTLGPVRRVNYLPIDGKAEDRADEVTVLKVRALVVDERQREWTMGELHEVTERSFAIRRVLHVNDSLPAERAERWTWEPGPWLLVDRETGHISVVKLPLFDAAVSDVAWYRDYAAYCGTGSTAKGGLFAMVAQLSGRKAVAQKQIGPWPQENHFLPVCQPAEWQRAPMRVTLKPTGGDAVTFNVVGTVGLVEEDEQNRE